MMADPSGVESELVVHVCEHCLYPYGWFRSCESPPPKRILTFRPPFPCPRCGYLQQKTQDRRRRRKQRFYYGWLVLLGVLILLPTTVASGLSMGWGVRPFGPIAVGGALMLIVVGVWSGFYRWALADDPNGNMDLRRKRAAACEESPHVLTPQSLAKVRSEEEALPTPPPWSWEEAERRYRSRTNVKSRLGYVLRGFLYGLIPALICLGSTKFYLDITRTEWEYVNLLGGNQLERTRAIDHLWSHRDEEQKELVLQWFSSNRMTSQEADIYLIHIKPLRASHIPKVLNAILTMQTGAPGPQAWQILQNQPGLVAQRILQNLDRGVGDPARNLAILAKLDPAVLAETFQKEIVVKPELIEKLGEYGALLDDHWPVIAEGVLRSSEGDPRLRLQLIDSLLAVVPDDSLDPLLREALDSLGDWPILPVANAPRDYLRVALFSPRPEWVEAIFEGIAAATDDAVPLSIKAAEALHTLGPETVEKALDPLFASAEPFRWMKLRLRALHDPESAAIDCERLLESYVDRDWGTVTADTLSEQTKLKADLVDTARTLKGVPLDSTWTSRCRKAFRIQDPEVRQEWVLLLSDAPVKDLLRSFSATVGSPRQYREWEVDALVSAVAENQETTLEEIADLLHPTSEEADFHLSPVVKYALLDYLGKAGSLDIVPTLKELLEDDSVVYRSTVDTRGASETVRVGDFAAEVIRTLEEAER